MLNKSEKLKRKDSSWSDISSSDSTIEQNLPKDNYKSVRKIINPNKRINSTTVEFNENFRTNKKSTAKLGIKQHPESVVYDHHKLQKGRSSAKRVISSLRNKTSQTAKKPHGDKKASKILDNPEITKLAPFSASLVTGKRPKYSHLSTPSCKGANDGANCLKSIAERKTILREIQNLSQALLSQQTKFDLAMDRVKQEHKRYKKQKKAYEK